jgi:hypothetical protein
MLHAFALPVDQDLAARENKVSTIFVIPCSPPRRSKREVSLDLGGLLVVVSNIASGLEATAFGPPFPAALPGAGEVAPLWPFVGGTLVRLAAAGGEKSLFCFCGCRSTTGSSHRAATSKHVISRISHNISSSIMIFHGASLAGTASVISGA